MIKSAKDVNLNSELQILVDKYVEHYKTDFVYDIKQMVEEKETEYILYLRKSGTQLLKVNDLKYVETSSYINAKYWLTQADLILGITVTGNNRKCVFGTIKIMNRSQMDGIIKKTIPMSNKISVQYLIDWIEYKINSIKDDNEILIKSIFHAISAYHYRNDYLSNMISSMYNSNKFDGSKIINYLTSVRDV